MSARIGHHQRSILVALRDCRSATTFESLRWTLWKAEHPDGGELPDLPTKRDTSIKRALDGLVEKGHVQINSRPLASLNECVEHFPQKTLSTELRQLRRQLIPVLFEWPDAYPRYTSAENERFHLKSISENVRNELLRRWCCLEPKLIVLLHQCEQPIRNQLFLLIAKGKALFETSDLDSRRSFGELAVQLLQTGVCSPEVERMIRDLNENLLESNEAGFLRLKSVIHSVANVPVHGRDWSLKTQTVEYLESRCHDVLSSLPGYQSAEPPPGRRNLRLMMMERQAVQSRLLQNLLDHTVYTRFRFVEVA